MLPGNASSRPLVYMAQPCICIPSLTLNLNIDQLEAYEEFITSSITANKAIHDFNTAVLEANRNYLLAS